MPKTTVRRKLVKKEQYTRSSEKQEKRRSSGFERKPSSAQDNIPQYNYSLKLLLQFVALFSIRLPSSCRLMQLEFIRVE